MRLSLRFIVPLGLALAAIAYAVVPLVDRLTLQWFERDLEIRATTIANAAQEPLAALVRVPGARQKLQLYLARIVQDERIFAIGFCDRAGTLLHSTATFPAAVRCAPAGQAPERNRVVQLPDGPLHVSANPVSAEGEALGDLVIVHDMSFVTRRSDDTKKYVVWLFAAIAAVVALITVVIAEISWRGWVAGMKRIISGEALLGTRESLRVTAPELRPIARDLQALVRDLEAERHARDETQMTWGPEVLRGVLREDLKGDEVLIVSNREPYIHVRRKDNVIEIQRPASGLVTALEPVMRACSGTWIAHGAGSADRDTVDQRDHVRVPPEKPAYQIRRVWLSKEEEQGYYYGFANEGLWPLCHIAHTRPVFRAQDWEHYKAVNRRFANAVVDEVRTEDPIILVQDYHFALLPRMVRERLPRATIIAFWHIPWPNPEAFGILPWREEVLEGLLGSSIIGFHTQFHCNNFFDTADRFLEARVDRETFTISYGGTPTEVRRYPISIEWPPAALATQAPVAEARRAVRERLGLAPDVSLGIGVDRLDYTKGILERFMAVERLLELEPRWVGKFAFVQAAAPSRSSIDEYQNLEARVRELAERINRRFGSARYRPIVLRIEHHDAAQVYELYRAADLCCVSSLHDGMNLVAKEFVAARDDQQGVLILSQFTGAARELVEALAINPYDIEQSAAAMHLALTMPPAEQRARMRSMRALVQDFNVYRWAGRMLLDAARMRHRRRVLARARAARREAGRAERMADAALPPFAAHWGFFLDIDGTLLDLAERPDAVRAGQDVHRLLEALQRGSGGALALISGRSVHDIDRLFAPLALPAAGQHGVERRDAAGQLHQHGFAEALMRSEAIRLGEFAARHDGLLLEDKGRSLALHYRLAPQFAGEAQAALREAAARLGDQVEVLQGKMVVELKPSGRDKGKAIGEFMREPPFAGRTPVFIGDDSTDEYGFGVVNRLGGHTVKVGAGASAARHRVATAAAVREWLSRWAECHA